MGCGAGASPRLRACEGTVRSASSGSSGWQGSRRRSSATRGLHSTAGGGGGVRPSVRGQGVLRGLVEVGLGGGREGAAF